MLSARLAPRCDKLMAIDLSPLGVYQARIALAPFAGTDAHTAALPVDWPEGCYDPDLQSEIIYYPTAQEIEDIARLVARHASDTAECILVHWIGDTQTSVTPAEACDQNCELLPCNAPLMSSHNGRTVMITARSCFARGDGQSTSGKPRQTGRC